MQRLGHERVRALQWSDALRLNVACFSALSPYCANTHRLLGWSLVSLYFYFTSWSLTSSCVDWCSTGDKRPSHINDWCGAPGKVCAWDFPQTFFQKCLWELTRMLFMFLTDTFITNIMVTVRLVMLYCSTFLNMRACFLNSVDFILHSLTVLVSVVGPGESVASRCTPGGERNLVVL